MFVYLCPSVESLHDVVRDPRVCVDQGAGGGGEGEGAGDGQRQQLVGNRYNIDIDMDV